jgi:hypothetical protein
LDRGAAEQYVVVKPRGPMASMGKRSLTPKAWKAQGCFAAEVRFIGRRAKRTTKGYGARALRRQAKKDIALREGEAR